MTHSEKVAEREYAVLEKRDTAVATSRMMRIAGRTEFTGMGAASNNLTIYSTSNNKRPIVYSSHILNVLTTQGPGQPTSQGQWNSFPNPCIQIIQIIVVRIIMRGQRESIDIHLDNARKSLIERSQEKLTPIWTILNENLYDLYD